MTTAAPSLSASAATRAGEPPLCAFWLGAIRRMDIATLLADIASLLPVPEHDLGRKGAAADLIPQTLRKLSLTRLKRCFRLFDLLPQLLRLVGLWKLVPDTFEEIYGRLAGGEVVGQFLDDAHATPP
jgi:hypothetical protein